MSTHTRRHTCKHRPIWLCGTWLIDFATASSNQTENLPNRKQVFLTRKKRRLENGYDNQRDFRVYAFQLWGVGPAVSTTGVWASEAMYRIKHASGNPVSPICIRCQLANGVRLHRLWDCPANNRFHARANNRPFPLVQPDLCRRLPCIEISNCPFPLVKNCKGLARLSLSYFLLSFLMVLTWPFT